MASDIQYEHLLGAIKQRILDCGSCPFEEAGFAREEVAGFWHGALPCTSQALALCEALDIYPEELFLLIKLDVVDHDRGAQLNPLVPQKYQTCGIQTVSVFVAKPFLIHLRCQRRSSTALPAVLSLFLGAAAIATSVVR